MIADRPLTDIVPLQLAEDRTGGAENGERSYRTVTQYSMKPIEEIGLLKMDFLGLRNLDVIEAALDIIEESSGERPDMTTLPLDDPKTYEMLARGRLGRRVPVRVRRACARRCARSSPTSSTTSSRSCALYRPGAMRYIDTYARNKRIPGRRSTTSTSACARSPSPPTRGDPLPGAVDADREGDRRLLGPEADDLRKAIGKKQRDRMAALKRPLLRGRARHRHRRGGDRTSCGPSTRRRPTTRSTARHAACYALISYRTAWLKANYPAEYMAALISSVMSTKDKVPFFVAQCEDMGIEVLPPDVNQSGHDFKVVEGNIRFGLDAVKGLGYQAVEAIIQAREEERAVHLDLGLLPARGLPGREQEGDRVAREVRGVRLPAGHAHRDDGGAAAARRPRASRRSRTRAAGSRRSSTSTAAAARGRRRRTTTRRSCRCPDDRKQLNEWEKETLGLFLSSHPLKEVRPALRARVDCSLAELAAKKDGEWVTVGGMIAECKRIRTKKGDPMMFATLDDLEGQVELLVFNSAYAANADKVDVDKIVIVRGRVDHKEEGETKLVAQEVEAFEPTAEEVAEGGRGGAARAGGAAAHDPRVSRASPRASSRT